MICYNLFFVYIRMSYYQLNRYRLLEKAKKRYYKDGGKTKSAKYYEDNKEVLRENVRNYKVYLKKKKSLWKR